MKRVAAVILAFTLSVAALCLPKVAVLDLAVSDGVDASMSAPITESIIEELVASKACIVVDRTYIAQVLQEKEFQVSGLFSDEQAAAAGQYLGADYVIAGRAQIAAGAYFVVAKLIDVRTGAILAQSSATQEGKALVLIDLARQVGKKLASVSTTVSYPSMPSPASGWTDLSSKISRLDWADSSSVYGGSVKYDIYFGTGSLPSSPTASSLTSSEWTLPAGAVSPGLSYSWRVVARDDRGATAEGPIWNFRATDGSDLFDHPEIRIPSAPLRAAIEASLGSRLTGNAFKKVASLKGLDSKYANLGSIEGIDYCSGLEWLYMENAGVANLGPMAALKSLKRAWIGGNPFTDLSPLVGLPQLDSLSITSCPLLSWQAVSVLTPANFPVLTEIMIGGRDLERAPSPFSYKQVEGLLSAFNGLISISLRNFRDMGDAGVATLISTTISHNLANFTGLTLWGCGLTNVGLSATTGVGSLTNLYSLCLYENPGVSSIASLTGLTKLNHFGIWTSPGKLESLAPLQTLYNAGAFHLDHTGGWLNLDLRSNNLDLRTGSADRAVIDFLRSKGVTVQI